LEEGFSELGFLEEGFFEVGSSELGFFEEGSSEVGSSRSTDTATRRLCLGWLHAWRVGAGREVSSVRGADRQVEQDSQGPGGGYLPGLRFLLGWRP
jgi:hypothetical protein